MRSFNRATALVTALAILGSAAPPAMAQTQTEPQPEPVHHHHHHHRTSCESARRRSANTGTVLGAIGGGIIGSQLAGSGSRTLGTVLGAGGGAVVGHQIGAHSHRC
jgi:uncharacterized protein YcfJ